MPSMPSAKSKRIPKTASTPKPDHWERVGRDGLIAALNALDKEDRLWLNVAVKTAEAIAEVTAIDRIVPNGTGDTPVQEVRESLRNVFDTAWNRLGDCVVGSI